MSPRRAEQLALGVIAVAYVFLTFLTYDHVEEDAFVYFRQAAMIADGEGYVWNRGGERVEASSSPLWLLLLVVLERCSVDLLIGAKVMGCAFGVVTLVLTHRLASGLVRDPLLRLLPSAVLAVSTPFVMNNQRGLETPLFSLLVLLLCMCCTERAWFRFWWLAASLVVIARPEGFFVLLALVPVLSLRRDEGSRIARGTLALGAAVSLLLAARFAYFHDFLPNPFYIKMRLEGWLGVSRVHWLFYGNFLYVFALPLLFTLRDSRFWDERRIALASFVFVQIFWTVLAQDYMPYYRHMTPALPLVYVLIASGLDRAASPGGTPAASWRRALALGAGVALVCATLWFSFSVGYFQRDFKNPVRIGLASFLRAPAAHVSAIVSKMRDPFAPTALDPLLRGTATIGNNYQALVGEFLRRNYRDDIVVVYDQMGQTPFYAGPGVAFIDSWGLTDRTVARHYFEAHLAESGSRLFGVYASLLDRARTVLLPEAERAALAPPAMPAGALDHLFARQPDLILINSFLTDDAPDSLPARVRRDPRLERLYRHTWRLAGFVDVFERTDRPPRREDALQVPRGLAVDER